MSSGTPSDTESEKASTFKSDKCVKRNHRKTKPNRKHKMSPEYKALMKADAKSSPSSTHSAYNVKKRISYYNKLCAKHCKCHQESTNTKESYLANTSIPLHYNPIKLSPPVHEHKSKEECEPTIKHPLKKDKSETDRENSPRQMCSYHQYIAAVNSIRDDLPGTSHDNYSSKLAHKGYYQYYKSIVEYLAKHENDVKHSRGKQYKNRAESKRMLESLGPFIHKCKQDELLRKRRASKEHDKDSEKSRLIKESSFVERKRNKDESNQNKDESKALLQYQSIENHDSNESYKCASKGESRYRTEASDNTRYTEEEIEQMKRSPWTIFDECLKVIQRFFAKCCYEYADDSSSS